ncbi:MAG: isopentenyl-diphosphate Delta-isomerase [Flammeovirgaceae bacterium]
MDYNQVILVDEQDNAIGTMEKMQAHREGKLHRAFSVFVFNEHNELLIHQRAEHKYHSGGLWTNTCCSHPMPHETVEEAAHRRLVEEMGFDCDLFEVFAFSYYAELDKGLTEHEYDHVFFGRYKGKPNINPAEVSDYKYRSISAIKTDIAENPNHYTEWFKLIFQQIDPHLNAYITK